MEGVCEVLRDWRKSTFRSGRDQKGVEVCASKILTYKLPQTRLWPFQVASGSILFCQ